MSPFGLRRSLGTRILGDAVRRGREVSVDRLERPALVFAPHPDDDVLACGGTILHKTRLGVPVRIVYMTGGGKSLDGIVDESELRARRAREATEAASAMGVPADDLTFLGFPDRALERHTSEAAERVEAILARFPDADLFVPSVRDLHPDHAATARIVDAAVAADVRPRVRYEYEVYFWTCWPWCGVTATPGLPFARWLHGILRMGRGPRLGRLYPDLVRVGEVLEGKRAALERHRSQMEPPGGDPSGGDPSGDDPSVDDWPEAAARGRTLPEVGGGDFLEWFFSGFEFFRRRE